MTTTKFYFDNKPELRTSYANQRSIAARDLGHDVTCIHDKTVGDGCALCGASGTPLIPIGVTR